MIWKPGRGHRLVCRAAKSEPSEPEEEEATTLHVATIRCGMSAWPAILYSFLIAEIAGLTEVQNVFWGRNEVINCLNCALVFAFRQIPSPHCVEVCQHVIVTTCWETHLLSHLELGKWGSENASPSAGSLQDLPRCGDAEVCIGQGDSYEIVPRANTVCQAQF